MLCSSSFHSTTAPNASVITRIGTIVTPSPTTYGAVSTCVSLPFIFSISLPIWNAISIRSISFCSSPGVSAAKDQTVCTKSNNAIRNAVFFINKLLYFNSSASVSPAYSASVTSSVTTVPSGCLNVIGTVSPGI